MTIPGDYEGRVVHSVAKDEDTLKAPLTNISGMPKQLAGPKKQNQFNSIVRDQETKVRFFEEIDSFKGKISSLYPPSKLNDEVNSMIWKFLQTQNIERKFFVRNKFDSNFHDD